MKLRIFIWFFSALLALGIFYRWYISIPPMLTVEPYVSLESHEMTPVNGQYLKYKSQKMLIYGSGGHPNIDTSTIKFTDGVWIIRSIDPSGVVSFKGPNTVAGNIEGKGTIFLDFGNNTLLSIDALINNVDTTKILPSFYVHDGKKMFYDLTDIDRIIDQDLWKIYKENALRDEKQVYGGFSDDEIIKNITILLQREPKKDDSGNTYFKKVVGMRTILEDILSYMDKVKKQKKCGENSGACLRFITSSIQEGKKIDEDIFIGLEEPLLMWAKKNSNLDTDYSWESIFQRYHLDVLMDNPLAVSTRDSAIVAMIQSSQDPTYEMWLYLTFILSKEKNGSPYALKIMHHMIRIGELLKNNKENEGTIVEESNKALANLRKVLEESYFDKRDDYLFVLKQDLKDERGQKIDTTVFVNDLNLLISEIDKSTLFQEYPDFRILRRHLTWFTCIFQKNKEYLLDIRVCRGDL